VKSTLIILTAVAILVAAVSAASRLSAASAAPAAAAANPCSPLLRLPRATQAGEVALYGHIKSLARKGARFELRFDPAWVLTGATANRAALEDTGSSDVPNDSYTRDESHRLLSFLVPATAQVTVLSHATCTTRTTVAKLARSVPQAGFWIRVRSDTVRSLDQQYHP
jgi:hypothetical protein